MARPRALGGDERCKEQICIEANRLENAARAVRDMATEEELDPTRSNVLNAQTIYKMMLISVEQR